MFDECHYPIFSTIQNFCKQCPFAKEQYCRPAIMNELIIIDTKRDKSKTKNFQIAQMISNVGQEINIAKLLPNYEEVIRCIGNIGIVSPCR